MLSLSLIQLWLLILLFTYFSLIFCIAFVFLSAQEVKIHSHNDYLQETPFWGAFASGAHSIEVDLVLKNDTLYVAHEESSIIHGFTFKAIYLEALDHISKNYAKKRLNFQLLIDIKTAAEPTLQQVIQELQPYKKLCKPFLSNGITITISGNRPEPKKYINYPEHIFFDCQEITSTPKNAWRKVSMISTSFKNLSWWNGLGRMVQKDKQLVQDFISRAKMHDKPIRLWASPDTKTAWKSLSLLGVDYINTDMPEKAIPYFKSLEKNTFSGTSKYHTSYNPTFEHDEHAEKVKNIILLIGDGMGLSQISTGDFLTQRNLNITQLRNIGLIRTQAADNFGTDSAAGATAYATGVQTNNRAIGTDIQGNKLTNLIELLSKSEFSTAIVTNDNITGATPAAFYAHVKDRNQENDIIQDLFKSELDFFVAANNETIEKRREELEQYFSFADPTNFQFETNKKIALFFSEKSKNSAKSESRSNMAQLISIVLPHLKSKQKPFFIMIEGAKIDSYGHANSLQGVVDELFDFDSVVGEALKFADFNKETLVLVTADHETGGLSLLDANIEKLTLEGGFTTNDHTGTLVPVFAYGPSSSLFQGVFPNYVLHDKIISVLMD